ncbi:unannotated protein [freshwater metagenome]|uniref:Unannotated protein n=1 Tax=freshwater metagenome TaxID=449393 RepID=A0A6J6ERC1_9ZZZZ
MRAIDGVHCRCVTWWRRSCAAGVRSSSDDGWAMVASDGAGAFARFFARSRWGRLSSTVSVGTPKSMRQPISFTPMPLSSSIIGWTLSGVPNRPLDS